MEPDERIRGKYYLTVGCLTIFYLMIYEFFANKSYHDSAESAYWQRYLYVSQTFFPVIFGYFLDRFGRRNCMLLLTLNGILPGLLITLSAYFSSTPGFVRVGMLLLGASFQSCNVAMITGLFAWTGNVIVYILSVTLVQMLNLIGQYHTDDQKPDMFDTGLLSCFVPLTLLFIVLLWRLQKVNKQPKMQYETKKYLLNVYFLFAIVQSFIYSSSDLILGNILTSNNVGGYQKQHQPIPGTIVCYGSAFLILVIILMQKRVALMMMTYIADIMTSFAILMLMVLYGTRSFDKQDFMRPAISYLSLALTSTGGYIFLICSLMVVMRSTLKKGMAVGMIISICRFTRIVLADLQVIDLIWICMTALLIQKICYFLLGFYDTKRYRIMFKPHEECVGFSRAATSSFKQHGAPINDSLA